jgi:nucleoid-associated protein YgaU
VTATKKVLLATLIVSAGYGLALLLGAPSQVPFSWRPQLAATTDNQPAQALLNVADSATAAGHWALGGPQLIPDVRPPEPAEDASAIKPLAPTDQSSDSSFALENVASTSPHDATALNQRLPSPLSTIAGPRAILRNEAPRPLAAEPCAPVTIKNVEPIARANVETANTIQLLSLPPQAPTGLTSAQFAGDSSSTTPSAAMGYQPVVGDQQSATAIAPPPFPPVENLDEPRSHIIIDGDSLAKLAGRYLDDPHRGDEIYELNRHLLQDPELLPIGAEIEIPTRNNPPTISAESPHSYLPSGSTIHAAARGGGLVPVRPIPASARVMPRAQLTTPLPVE